MLRTERHTSLSPVISRWLASPTKRGDPIRFQSKKLITTTPTIGVRRRSRNPARLGASRTYASTVVRMRLRLRRRAPSPAGEGAASEEPRSAAGLDTTTVSDHIYAPEKRLNRMH
ncbi:hypothetical protein GCM10011578_022300 [Streptomyces fuscichromogenes]|uniref:Uncharacterized protein n=1 Tax=Streptomyces fuscichromogenes TaxID=1324013 RepID=A0A917XAA7_9ACTN|nr:hypothetical protein GCM10011578_022300 [Streptomyces fuscichromogenes]